MSGFLAVEPAEKWIRTVTPYSYNFRFGECDSSDCCKSLTTSGASDLSNVYFSRFSDSKFMSSNGYSIVRMTEPGFSGWLVKDRSGKNIYNAQIGNNFCASDDLDWFRIGEMSSWKSNLKIKCATGADPSWSNWSNWSKCSCRHGGQARERKCQNSKSSNECPGIELETKACQVFY